VQTSIITIKPHKKDQKKKKKKKKERIYRQKKANFVSVYPCIDRSRGYWGENNKWEIITSFNNKLIPQWNKNDKKTWYFLLEKK